MKSNYKKLGQFIRAVNIRNTDLEVERLLGLSISKQFIPSVANTVGTNMRNYKIIRKNQFACSIMQVRRDGKMPVALLKDIDEAIISQAYPVFQVIDENIMLPEYMMMWFSRSEFDREACFHAVGGVRGSLEWEDFLDMKLPVPPIEKQREIVAEYNAVTNRIKLNEQLNQKLEETAQAVYKHWFVDFEFPNEEGKPYKSSGGKMVYNEELDKDIPEGWREIYLNTLLDIKHGFAFKGEYITDEVNQNILITPGNFKIGGGFKDTNFRYYVGNFPQSYIFRAGEVIVTMTDLSKEVDTLGFPAIIPHEDNKQFLHNQRIGRVEFKENSTNKLFFYWLMRSFDYRKNVIGSATGTTVKHTSPTKILDFVFPKPTNILLDKFENMANKMNSFQEQIMKESQTLKTLQSLLLSKLAGENYE